MNISQLIQWIVAHPWDFLGHVAAASVAFAAAWASVKAAVQKVTGRAMPRNALTTALDVLAELAMNIPGAINRLVRAGGSPSIFAPPSTPAPPSNGQRGAVRVGALLALCVGILVASALGAVLTTGCVPPPPSDGGTPVVTPSGWTQTARIAVVVGRGLLPVARVIVEATVTDPGLTHARRAFEAADDALVGLSRALDAYDARGGDRCVARAAAGAAGVALQELAQVLADNGIALGVPLGRVVDLVASVVDTLIPACDLDAGFASAGRAANDRLRTIESNARARGISLSRVLDGITPQVDAGTL